MSFYELYKNSAIDLLTESLHELRQIKSLIRPVQNCSLRKFQHISEVHLRDIEHAKNIIEKSL